MIMANTIDKNRRPSGKSENQKLKSLLVEKVLLHETDEEHALSSTDIIPVDLNIKHRPQKAPKRGARFCENPQKIVPT